MTVAVFRAHVQCFPFSSHLTCVVLGNWCLRAVWHDVYNLGTNLIQSKPTAQPTSDRNVRSHRFYVPINLSFDVNTQFTIS